MAPTRDQMEEAAQRLREDHAPGAADPVRTVALDPGASDEARLDALTAIERARARLDDEESRLLERLRRTTQEVDSAPVAWPRIGAALGVTRQGAERRLLRAASAGVRHADQGRIALRARTTQHAADDTKTDARIAEGNRPLPPAGSAPAPAETTDQDHEEEPAPRRQRTVATPAPPPAAAKEERPMRATRTRKGKRICPYSSAEIDTMTFARSGHGWRVIVAGDTIGHVERAGIRGSRWGAVSAPSAPVLARPDTWPTREEAALALINTLWPPKI